MNPIRSLVAAVLLVSASIAQDRPTLRTFGLPAPAARPHVVADSRQVFHAIYGEQDAAWYCRSEDGVTWSTPVKVGADCHFAGERGPRVAIGGAEILGAIWQGKSGLKCFVSADGGKSWSASSPRDKTARNGVDVPTICGDGLGSLVAAWVDGRNESRKVEGDIYSARLVKGDADWTQNVRVNPEGTRICPCCMPSLASDAQGVVHLAARTAIDDVREIEMFTSRDAMKWDRTPISKDGWKLDSCPMSGPALAVSPDGRSIALAWRGVAKLQWALSRNGGKTFTAGNTLDTVLAMADYPLAGIDDLGRTVIAWTSRGEPRVAFDHIGKGVAAPQKNPESRPVAAASTALTPVLLRAAQ